jgi:hypothetical protein
LLERFSSHTSISRRSGVRNSDTSPPRTTARLRRAARTRRQTAGCPLYSLPEGTIADGIVWALDRDKTYAVIRSDIGVMIDPSFYFGSDSLAVRVIIRVGFGYPHHAAICKITLGGGS